MQDNLILRPLWDWGEQFIDKDISLFTNPLFKKPSEQPHQSRKSMAYLPSSAIPLPGLHNNSRMSLNVNQLKRNSPAHARKLDVSIARPSLTTLFNRTNRINSIINCPHFAGSPSPAKICHP